MRESYGLRVLGFRIIRRNQESFRDLVAQECYGLTHELTTSKLMSGFMDGRDSRYTNAAWLELDRAMLEFTTSQRRTHERRTHRAIWGHLGIRRRS